MSELPDLTGKTVVVGVSGSIAAYKAADLCSKLVQSGATVYAILTRSATRFVAPTTFWGITGNPVTIDAFEEPFAAEPGISPIAHLRYAQQADAFVIAPASANLLARLAAGLADDMLTAALLANTERPTLLAPAMNTHMWENAATQENVTTLSRRGYRFIAPGVGRLAEGTVGAGRMAELQEILTALTAVLQQERNLSGRHFLVTAGPTREAIDPVRFLSNRSSGKMGYAIAAVAAERGATVTLVSGPTALPTPPGVTRLPVLSASEMALACFAEAERADVIVAAAAVADYTPATVAPEKLKKQGETLTLTLVPTIDILQTLGERKRPGQTLIGFAAETESLLAHAQAKLQKKNLDLIVANDVTQAGAGFDSETNIVTLLTPNAPPISLPQMSKIAVAHKICDWLVASGILLRPGTNRLNPGETV